jgi:hypothetical protein
MRCGGNVVEKRQGGGPWYTPGWMSFAEQVTISVENRVSIFDETGCRSEDKIEIVELQR